MKFSVDFLGTLEYTDMVDSVQEFDGNRRKNAHDITLFYKGFPLLVICFRWECVNFCLLFSMYWILVSISFRLLFFSNKYFICVSTMYCIDAIVTGFGVAIHEACCIDRITGAYTAERTVFKFSSNRTLFACRASSLNGELLTFKLTCFKTFNAMQYFSHINGCSFNSYQ